jgi:outer membrane protein OmpA-like peptidoglycan-associated protein
MARKGKKRLRTSRIRSSPRFASHEEGKTMRVNRSGQLLALGLALGLGGCAEMERRTWNGCAVAGGIIGGMVGGAGAGVGVSEGARDPSDAEIAGAAAGGTIVGAGLGALLGHVLCDPVETPPPPPPMAPPPPPPPPPVPRKIETLHGPQFDSGKATLRPDGKKRLDHVVQQMRDDPGLRVSVDGYTDAVGSEEYNQRLSMRRAEAVKRYLVANGIDESRIGVRALGESNPVGDNATAKGRAENRRVEIVAQ